jgi:hypothetical protein
MAKALIQLHWSPAINGGVLTVKQTMALIKKNIQCIKPHASAWGDKIKE